MNHIGEIISLLVAVLWTVAAMTCEAAGRRFGVLMVNVWRMLLGVLLSAAACHMLLGTVLPPYADLQTWLWLLASGAVGFFLGDYCLLNSYLHIGSRNGQLFMTTAPIFSAFGAWLALGQTLTPQHLLAMGVTLTGIAIAIVGKGEGKTKVRIDLPLRGVLFGIGAGMGQGFGYVLSVIGLKHYESVVPTVHFAELEHWLPFSANFIRMLAGLCCFGFMLWRSRRWADFAGTTHDRKGMLIVLLAVLSGPVLGVGLSLMAAQYTSAGIASTLMAITPIIILLPSYWFFRSPITLKAAVGAVISVVGVSLFFI